MAKNRTFYILVVVCGLLATAGLALAGYFGYQYWQATGILRNEQQAEVELSAQITTLETQLVAAQAEAAERETLLAELPHRSDIVRLLAETDKTARSVGAPIVSLTVAESPTAVELSGVTLAAADFALLISDQKFSTMLKFGDALAAREDWSGLASVANPSDSARRTLLRFYYIIEK